VDFDISLKTTIDNEKIPVMEKQALSTPSMCQGMKKCYGEPGGHEAEYGGYSQDNTYGNSPCHDPTSKKSLSKSLPQHRVLDSFRKVKFGYENLKFH
jgi:hypothetical protein